MRLIAASVFIGLALSSVSCQSQNGNIKQLDAQAFEQSLKKAKAYNLIDIRTPDEYQQGHLENAEMIDYFSGDFKDKLNALDKNKPLFYYCASGGRSGKTIPILQELGFKEVYELKVGFKGWSQANKPFVK